MSAYTISEATPADLASLRAILAESGLSAHAGLAAGTRYWLANRADGEPIGVIGIELGAGAALLRSAAVRPAARSQGIGAALLRRAARRSQQRPETQAIAR